MVHAFREGLLNLVRFGTLEIFRARALRRGYGEDSRQKREEHEERMHWRMVGRSRKLANEITRGPVRDYDVAYK